MKDNLLNVPLKTRFEIRFLSVNVPVIVYMKNGISNLDILTYYDKFLRNS